MPTFDTVAAMVAGAASLSDGTMADTRSHTAVGDGGGASWVITDGVSPPTADGITVHNLGGDKRASLARAPRAEYDVRSVGVFGSQSSNTATSGAEVSSRLSSLFSYLNGRGGGTIYMPESITCNNTTFDSNVTAANWITMECRDGVEVTPGNPTADTYMWEFPTTGSSLTHVSLVNVRIFGNPDNKSQFTGEGVYIGPTNNGVIRGCSGHGINGVAFYISGWNNSRIDIKTFKCGTTGGKYAQTLTDNAVKGNNLNDCDLQCSSERDSFGIALDNALICRSVAAFKLHGGDEVIRALRILNCKGFDLSVINTQSWGTEGFIWIGDSGDVATHGETAAEGSAFSETSNGTIRYNNIQNNEYTGTGNAAHTVIDFDNNDSGITVMGYIREQRAPTNEGSGATHDHFAIDNNQGNNIYFSDGSQDGANLFQSDIPAGERFQ